MRVLVTGAGGFLGGVVAHGLAAWHEVVATDLHLPAALAGAAGDLTDPQFVARLFERRFDAVVHLATLPGGAAEQAPERAWRVNVEATRLIATHAAAAGNRPRFVYASSIAVFGDTDPQRPIDDGTPLAPAMIYGAHKAVCEVWLAAQARRGALRPVALRLPAIVARPGDGAGFGSAFMSNVFHAIAAGRRITLPVSGGATMWLMSARQAAANVAHALALADDEVPETCALTLPALRVAASELVAAIAGHCGIGAALDYAPDPAIERVFGSLPPLATALATARGFAHDGDLPTLVKHVLGDR